MSKFLFCCFLSLLGCTNNEIIKNEILIVSSPTSRVLKDTCVDFNSLNNKIRDGLISKQEALKNIQKLLPQLRNYYNSRKDTSIKKNKWVFPVQGYSSKTIGGKDGSGYIASSYNFFDGNKHGGHPAHDIFIVDKNQDCIDDITKKPVNVLSMTGGIVIAVELVWDTISNLRGGKYIWIYDPNSNSFFYYAHNRNVFVRPCDIVNPGDTIATVGRTGLNAFKKRSPTHLHIMQLKLDSTYYPRPTNCYEELKSINN